MLIAAIVVPLNTVFGVLCALLLARSSSPAGRVISAVVNGLAAAPFLVLVMLISSDAKLMGREANGRLASVLGWGTAALMATGVIVLLGRFLSRAL